MRGWFLIATWLAFGVPFPAAIQAADVNPVTPVPTAIPGNRAGNYIGQDVTIEGRVVAIHESPTATVLAFAPNFAGFTATILIADRDKFPSDLEVRVRDRLVRVSGTVSAYRGKPEMTLRDPTQLILAPPPASGSVAAHPAPGPTATSDGSLEYLRRALARIESRLDTLEGRMNGLEPAPSGGEDESPPDLHPQQR